MFDLVFSTKNQLDLNAFSWGSIGTLLSCWPQYLISLAKRQFWMEHPTWNLHLCHQSLEPKGLRIWICSKLKVTIIKVIKLLIIAPLHYDHCNHCLVPSKHCRNKMRTTFMCSFEEDSCVFIVLTYFSHVFASQNLNFVFLNFCHFTDKEIENVLTDIWNALYTYYNACFPWLVSFHFFHPFLAPILSLAAFCLEKAQK